MDKVFCHLMENGQLIPVTVYQRRVAQECNNSGMQAVAGNEWTFQSLLTATMDGDEKHLYECIGHLEYRIREFEKIVGCPRRRRTQVLAGLQDFATAHGQQLTAAQIWRYRKSEEGRHAATIYQN